MLVRIESYEDRAYDLDTLLYDKGIIQVNKEITMAMAGEFVNELGYLISEGKDAKVIISTPGGSVDAGLAMYDAIQTYSEHIDLYCIGYAYSMGAILLAAGGKGKRHILPHSKVMIHQPYTTNGLGGTADNAYQLAENLLKTKNITKEILVKHTGQSEAAIDAAINKDSYYTADEAIAFGLVDDICKLTDVFGIAV